MPIKILAKDSKITNQLKTAKNRHRPHIHGAGHLRITQAKRGLV